MLVVPTLWYCGRRWSPRLWGGSAIACVTACALGLHPGFTWHRLAHREQTVWGDSPSSKLQGFHVLRLGVSRESSSCLCGYSDIKMGKCLKVCSWCVGAFETLLLGSEGENVGLLRTWLGNGCCFHFLGTKHASFLLGLLGALARRARSSWAGLQVALEAGWALQPLTSEPLLVAWGEPYLQGFASSIPGVWYTSKKVLPHLLEPCDFHNWQEIQKG